MTEWCRSNTWTSWRRGVAARSLPACLKRCSLLWNSKQMLARLVRFGCGRETRSSRKSFPRNWFRPCPQQPRIEDRTMTRFETLQCNGGTGGNQ